MTMPTPTPVALVPDRCLPEGSTKLRIGMIGLGRMGAGMVTRLSRGGHESVVHDQAPEGIARLVALGATGAVSSQQFVDRLSEVPRRGHERNPDATDLHAQFADDRVRYRRLQEEHP